MPHGRNVQVVAISAAIGAVVAVGAVAAAGPWDGGQRTAERSLAAARDSRTAAPPAVRPSVAAAAAAVPPAPSAAPVLAAAGTGRPPAVKALAARLAPLMTSPDLGTTRTGAVLDVATGRLLYDHRSGTASTPASTTKLATATAALGTLGGSRTLTTRVVTTTPGRIVLVGGGDPTLELGGLAADTAAALRARGATSVRLGYDTSLYSGPVLHPIGRNENLAPVTALMVREGRLDGSASGPATRTTDPALSAAASFAKLLRSHGITVTGHPAAARGAGGTQLAAHQSAPVSALVERMLTDSDNDLAEALARQVALATGRPASFAGSAKAVAAALRRYGVPLTSAVFADGSGLDHVDALSPATLTRILALAASPAHSELRPVLTGLPIASFTGTLAARFTATPGAGVVRAKTGTLTGTNTIAGVTVTPSGRVLAFCFMTQGAPSATAAQSALDALGSAVSSS
ncbi:D-alanyl-D-alanine carboxypeptidase/D-alanyl-D-alanine endopeptidase [Actinacidiphila paucisporea]|uniref:D-alanyl-D-alanine carboxypeptidase / D-alanyl-D-alanine-endopeptidase (Penicillin-binding protein 4) n=1 Tax=Actinacidiphila paucisporea TaxID=310782 RepID=A0A1M7HVB5_9ACTN|nr:D-alanyl-D-alanine carboxypeptidase/D-alanyl-D-alanine-endopeptidase [Actinacidiphila paucisporea]SHM32293.1 D-alanyl-D-alanine carboxypeptidase / D-alanyl-D-alanine-endopeptidase (penicillin-binding protein 4) [Actinacidiphila paucisporea]